MISLNAVYKRYGRFDALSNVNLQIPSGDMAFITGHSGAGKTTLLKLIAFLEPCSAGQIVVNGFNLSRLSPRKIPFFRRGVGVVFQDYRLLRDRTVFDNVALPLQVAGVRSLEIAKRVRAALSCVDLLTKADLYPPTLSGGEQQRVGIARAVVNKPHLLLADEPTGNLDPELSKEIMQLFIEFNRVGTTVIIASHDIPLIGHLGYPLYTLSGGQLLAPATPKTPVIHP